MKTLPTKWCEWFNLLDAGVAFLDLDGCLIEVNDAFTELLGYSHTELKGKSIRLITHLDDIDANSKELQKVVREDVEHYALLKRYITKSGNSLWVKVIVYPVKNSENKIIHLFKQVIPIKNGAKEQIKKIDNNVQVIETLSLSSFFLKNWWRIMQIVAVMAMTIGGWVYSATLKMYADSARLDRLERIIEKDSVNDGKNTLRKDAVHN